MSKKTRHELLSALRIPYRKASAKAKNKIIDNFVASTGYSRKHAIALLNREPTIKPKPARKREDKRSLGPEARDQLALIWNVCNQICGKRLAPGLPEVIANLEKHGHLHISAEARTQLLTVSAATIDRALKVERAKSARSLSHTKRGSLVKNKVPVRTFTEWDDVQPGFFEIDTVSHSSGDPNGPFLSTLNMTDIATCWTLPLALFSKQSLQVIDALDAASTLIPFPILGLDFDNGSEFLNEVLITWCESREVTYTRSREYKKNDQAWIEEKNGSVVRKNVGRERYTTSPAFQKLSELYSVLHQYYNFFQPVQKLLSKHRDGAKSYKKHDTARTPYARVLESNVVSREIKSALQKQYAELDLWSLFQRLSRLKEELNELAEDVPNPILAVALAQRNATHKFSSLPAAVRDAIDTEAAARQLTARLRELIEGLTPKTQLRSRDLTDFGDRTRINRSLHSLAVQGLLRRLEHGVFETTSPQKKVAPQSRKKTKADQIYEYLSAVHQGDYVTNKDLLHFGTEIEINSHLHRLVQRGIISKVERGVYMVRGNQVPQK